MEWVTTSLVLDQLRRHDDEAWQEFCARFQDPLIRFARSMGLDVSDAEDLAQETLLTFLQTFREGRYDRDRGRLSKWLFGIAYRKVLRARDRRRNQDRLGAAGGAPSSIWSRIPGQKDAHESWSRSWEQSVVRRCLDRIEREVQPRTMRAFRRLAFDRLSVAEVARELGLSENATTLAKHRVLKRLRELREQIEMDEGI